jgi:hypothetical protein
VYDLDLSTCDAEAVIRRSVICHPSLLRDRLCDVSRTYAEAAAAMANANRAGHHSASVMYEAAQRIIARLADGEELTGLDFNERIIAFSAAARLQCIPQAAAVQIIER